MRILITGNTSALSKRLFNYFSLDHEVLLTGRDGNADIYLDLLEIDNIPTELPETIDIIIHCIASFKSNSIIDAMENELINSVGTFKIMHIAHETKCKHIINISTLSVYDHEDNDYFGSYGLSKRHGQENLKYFCEKHNIQFTTLLLSQIYDEKLEFIKHQGMFYRMIENAKRGKNIEIYGSKDPFRNFLHVLDLIKIIELIIQYQITGEYNCVSPNSYRLSEVAEIAFKVFNMGGSVVFLRNKDDIGNLYIPSDSTLYELIKFKPEIDLQQGIQMLQKEYEERE